MTVYRDYRWRFCRHPGCVKDAGVSERLLCPRHERVVELMEKLVADLKRALEKNTSLLDPPQWWLDKAARDAALLKVPELKALAPEQWTATGRLEGNVLHAAVRVRPDCRPAWIDISITTS